MGIARMAQRQELEAAGLVVFIGRKQRSESRAGLRLPSFYPVQDPSPWNVLSTYRVGFHTPVQTGNSSPEVCT